MHERVLPLFTRCLCLWISALSAHAQTTYYISATGNDTNTGQSASAAFKSLTRIGSLTLQPGDSVLLRRGDTFRGTLQISRSGTAARPIVIGAYGNGAKPVLSGSVPVTGWTRTTANPSVWQATCAACADRVTGLHRSENPLPLGRYPNFDAPNKGYLTIWRHVEKYQIVSLENLPRGFAGGEAVMRPTQWIIDRAPIEAQYDNALNLINNSNYFPTDGWGFFIQNHPKTLDQAGEWCYVPSGKTLMLYDSLGNPNSQTLTATVHQKGLDLYDASNVVLRDLHFTETLATEIALSNVSSVSLVGVDVYNSGEDAITVSGSGNGLLIERCAIYNVNNNAIRVDAGYQNVIIRDNAIRRVGVMPGRGKSGDGQYNGIQSAGQHVLMEHNVVDSVGYNGITFWNNTTIRQNVIANVCMTKSDGGALYVWNHPKNPMTNIHLVSNIIYNALGAPEGSFRREYLGANGIFIDDCAHNISIRDNTIANTQQWGIYLHATSDIEVRGNTSFNSRESQFTMYHDAGHCDMRNHTVYDNIFVGLASTQQAAQIESYTNDLHLYGTFDNNYYISPFTNPNNIQAVVNATNYSRVPLSQWQARFGHDLHSRSTSLSYPEYLPTGGEGIPKLTNTFTTSADGWYTWSPYGNGQVGWQPSGQLDGGSLKISFSPPSGKTDSFQIPSVDVGPVPTNESFSVTFDAIAPGDTNRTVEVYFRQKLSPYEDVSNRVKLTVSQLRRRLSAALITRRAEAQTILIVQTAESDKPLYLDNLTINQGTYKRLLPEEYVKLHYNPTRRDSVLTLSGTYRDVKNRYYADREQVVLKPYTSLLLIKDTLRPADLRLSLTTSRRHVPINDDLLLTVHIDNQTPEITPAQTQWTCRLPPNLQVVALPPSVTHADGLLTGTIERFSTPDTTCTVRLRPTADGDFVLTGQIKLGLNTDPDSRADSGTGDGEDDTGMVTFRAGSAGTTAVYTSPNPNQLPLPPVLGNQPIPAPTMSCLHLGLALSRRVSVAQDTLTVFVTLSNAGGAAASVRAQVQLPATGMTALSGPGWQVDGASLTSDPVAVAPGQSTVLSLRVRTTSTTAATLMLRGQVFSNDKPDADSIAGNGFTNGERDEAHADLRVLPRAQ